MKRREQLEAYLLYIINNKYNPKFKEFKKKYEYDPIDYLYDFFKKNWTEELDFYHDLLQFKHKKKYFIEKKFNSSTLKKILNQ